MNPPIALARLDPDAPITTGWARGTAATGAATRQRYTVAALARADQIRAAGRTPVITEWEGHYPDGRPAEITILAVR